MAPTFLSMDHSLSLSTTIMRLVWCGDVVQRLEGDAAGEGGVAGHGHDVFLAAGLVARHGHAERGGERRARVAGAVAIVRAFGAQHEAVEAAGRADGVEARRAAGEQLVDVSLMADIEEEAVAGRVEDVMHGDGEFDHAKVGPEVTAVIGEAEMSSRVSRRRVASSSGSEGA